MNKLAAIGLVSASALILCACTSKESRDAEKILREMVHASSRTDFHGIKTMEQQIGNQFFRFRVEIHHRAPDLTRLELLEPQAKRGQVIIKRGQESWKLGAPHQEAMHFKRFGSHRDMEIHNIDLLLRNYRLHLLGTDDIASHLSDMIRMLSRWDKDMEWTVWVDRGSRLPLKSEERIQTPEGQSIRRFVYESIVFSSNIPKEAFAVPQEEGMRSAVPISARRSLTLPQARRTAPFPIVLPTDVPRGFLLEQIRWVQRAPSGFLHFHYSDGLRRISLFEEDREPVQNLAPEEGKIYQMRDGAMTILHRHMGPTLATLVGNLKSDDLVRMMSSLKPPED